MTKYEDMLNDVLPELMGCSVELAVNALRNTCIELFQKSWIYTQPMDTIPVLVDVPEYDLDSFSGYRIVGVVSAWFNDLRINPLAAEMINKNRLRWEADKGTVEGYIIKESNLIRLYRIPDQTGNLVLTVALAPTTKSTGIETFVYDFYSEAIAAGAKARLMAIPSKPFSNINASMMYRAQFAAAVTDAKWKAKQALTTSNLTVTK